MRTIPYKVISRNEAEADDIVSLATIQKHLLLLDSNDLLTGYRAAAINEIERYCNRALIPCTVECRLQAGTWTLPYGALAVVGDIPDGDRYDAISNRYTASQERVVTFEAGFTQVPAALSQAVLLRVAQFFENREAVTNGFEAKEMPLGFLHLLDLYRLNGGAL